MALYVAGCAVGTMPLSGDTKGLCVLNKDNKKPRIRTSRIVIPEPIISDGLGLALPHQTFSDIAIWYQYHRNSCRYNQFACLEHVSFASIRARILLAELLLIGDHDIGLISRKELRPEEPTHV